MTTEQTLPVGYKLTEDPILPGWPWVLELPSGQLAHFTTEDRAAEYATWHSNREDTSDTD